MSQYDSNAVIHERSLNLLEVMNGLAQGEISLEEVHEIIDNEKSRAKLKPPYQEDFFVMMHDLANQIHENNS